MKIFKNLFGNNSKISADEIALNDGRLVSKSVIVESGSNTNGDYVKLADGTMICWAHLIIPVSDWTKGSANAQGNAITTFTFLYTFPSAFNDIPSVQLDCSIDGSIYMQTCRNFSTEATKTKLYADCLATGNVGPNVRTQILAIGKWK